jgi:hypothetical protein
MSEEAQEAAAAAQQRAAAASAAASAAVQQAASSVSNAVEQAVEEAAAAAAALARNMRSVFEAQPAGWGVHEAIRGRTGAWSSLYKWCNVLLLLRLSSSQCTCNSSCWAIWYHSYSHQAIEEAAAAAAALISTCGPCLRRSLLGGACMKPFAAEQV